MRAVRVECSIPSIEHDQRVQTALQAVSWDYRGVLDQIDGCLRVMCECITTDGNCPSCQQWSHNRSHAASQPECTVESRHMPKIKNATHYVGYLRCESTPCEPKGHTEYEEHPE